MTAKPARTGDVQSVQRALDLLEIVARTGEIGVTELAHEAGLVVSTTHSLVRTLARRHYLLGVNGRYRLGPAATVLSTGWDPTASLSAIVAPRLEELSVRTEHASTAAVVVGRDARLVGYAQAPGPVTATAGQWSWSDPLGLATGRLVVAMAHEPDWNTIVERSLQLTPSHSAPPRWSTRRWLNELRAIQRAGIAVKTSRDPRSAAGIAVPVWARGGTVIASIGCSAPTFLIADLVSEATLDGLWETTLALSAELGCDDPPMSRPTLPSLQDTPLQENPQRNRPLQQNTSAAS